MKSTHQKFRGWSVLSGGFVNAMLIAGAAIYAFGLFVLPISEEFNLSREQVNYGILALYISMMVWAVFVGRWLETKSAKAFSIAGGLAFGLGYLMIATAQHPIMFLLAVLGPLGFGLTAAGPFLENALAARWFTKMRGRALGIAAIATSAGGFLVVPAFAALIERYGWRNATLIMAAGVTVIVVLISWRFVIGRPEDIGQYPDGIEANEEAPIEAVKARFINRADFWLISLGTGLLLGSDQALLISLIPYGEGLGFSKQQAAFVMTALTGSAIFGKIVVGWLAERWDKRLLFALVCLCNLAFLLALLMEPGYPELLLISALVGLAIGGVYPVWTTLTADAFGRENFSRVIGAMNLITVPLMLISITIIGRTFDKTGSYDLAFKIFIPQVILAGLFVFFVRQKND